MRGRTHQLDGKVAGEKTRAAPTREGADAGTSHRLSLVSRSSPPPIADVVPRTYARQYFIISRVSVYLLGVLILFLVTFFQISNGKTAPLER